MTTKPFIAFSLGTLLFAIGCNDLPDGGSVTHRVIQVSEDDHEMDSAVATAKETFWFFEDNWKTMSSDVYSIKFAMPTTDDGFEHIWFSPTKIDGDNITGECANDPEKIAGLKIGDTRTVSRHAVSDWMIVVGNKCYGGYTIRVLSKRSPDVAPPLEFVDPPVNENLGQ